MTSSSRFDVEITPTKKRDSEGGDETPVLEFRPFASIPKIMFKNVFVGDTVSGSIVLRNPQKEPIEIELSKLPSEKVGLTFSENKIHLLPSQEVSLTVNWKPKEEGKCIHSVLLNSNTNSKYISIVCVSNLRKQAKRVGKGTISKSTIKKKVILKNENVKPIERSETRIVHRTKREERERSSRSSRSSKIPVYASNIISNKFCKEIKDLDLDLTSLSEVESFIAKKSTCSNMKPKLEMSVPSVMTRQDFIEQVPQISENTRNEVLRAFNVLCSLLAKVKTLKSLCNSQKKIAETSTEASVCFSTPLTKQIPFSSAKYSFISHDYTNEDKRVDDFCMSFVDIKTNETFPDGAGVSRQYDSVIMSTNFDCISQSTYKISAQESTKFLSQKRNHCPPEENIVPASSCINTSKTKEYPSTLCKGIDNLDISGLSEIDSFIAKKSTWSNVNTNLELSIPPITPLQTKELLTGEEFLQEISQNFETTANECLNFNQKLHFQYNDDTATEYFYFSRKVMGKRDDQFSLREHVGTKIEGDFPNGKPTTFSGPCGNSLMPQNSGDFKLLHAFKEPKAKACLTFSAPRKLTCPREENVFPGSSSTMIYSTKQETTKVSPLKGRKGSIHHVLRETPRKKDLSYPISKLILSSKKKKIIEKETTVMDTEKNLSEQSNPSYCVTSTIINPFLNSAVYYDQQWFDAREKEFVRWLNVLLTPPEQLSSSGEMPKGKNLKVTG